AHARRRHRRRLYVSGHGVWPQRRLRAGRPRLGAGGLHARRLEDRAPARAARQGSLPGRRARLGQGRRYRELQAAQGKIRSMSFANLHPKEQTMTMHLRLLSAAAAAALLMLGAPVRADNFSAAQRGEIETIIKEYLIAHPEVLEEAGAELEKRKQAAEAEKTKQEIASHTQALFYSPRQVTVGDTKGEVTLVEFFDYNCGYCKRALADLTSIMKDDPK